VALRERRTRWLALAGAAATLVVAAAWLAWPRARAQVEPTPPPPVAAAPLAPATGTAEPEPDLELDALFEGLRHAPRPSPLAERAARDYRNRARFPHWSHAISDGVDPLVRDREVTAGHSFPVDDELVLYAEPARASFQSPDPVLLLARLEEEGRPVSARDVRGSVRTQAGTELASLRFRDEGRDGDAEADDLVYTARLDPEEAGGLSGSYLVLVEAAARDGSVRKAPTGFLYSVPASRLTGRFRDALVGGNLLVEAEIEVFEKSRFHLEATLGAPDGEPLAWAQQAAVLSPGMRWLGLTFYGLALAESGRDGPYRLLSVSLSTTGTMPNHPNDLLRRAHVTAAYDAASFTSQPFDDPGLLEAARQLEAETGVAAGGLERGLP